MRVRWGVQWGVRWSLVRLLLGVCISAWVVASCAVPRLSPGEALQADTDTGLVVMSLTQSGQRGFDLTVRMDGPDGGVWRQLWFPAFDARREWKGVAGIGPTAAALPDGHLLVLRLKPGTYRIDWWSGDAEIGGAYGTGYTIHSESVVLAFTSVAGKVTYAGNVHFDLPMRLNYSANQTPSTYRIAVESRLERDVALLRARYPLRDASAIDERLVRFDRAGQPLRYYIVNFSDSDEPPTR